MMHDIISPAELLVLGRHALEDDRQVYIGHPSGITELDAMIGGLRPRSLSVLASLPHHGKTSLATQIMLSGRFTNPDLRVLFVSLETVSENSFFLMAVQAVHLLRDKGQEPWTRDDTKHFVTCFLPRDYQDWPDAFKQIFWLHLDAAAERCFPEGLYTPSADTAALLDGITEWVKEQPHNQSLIVIDHALHLRQAATKRLDEHVFFRNVCMQLRDIAVNHDTSVLLCTQLNRSYETDQHLKTPRPGSAFHLQGASAFEQVADVVLILTRDDLIHKDNAAKGGTLAVLKDRHQGAVGQSLTFGFDPITRLFSFQHPLSA